MSDTKYTFSVANDFSDGIDPELFGDQIKVSSIGTNFMGIRVDGDVCDVWFSVELSAPNVTVLSNLVGAHDASEAVRIKTEEELKEQVLPKDYTNELTVSSTAVGMMVTTTIEELNIDDNTVVVADQSLTKYVLLSLVYSQTSDMFYIKAFEKTDGDYADLDEDEYLVQQDVSEWYVVANGGTLVEVT